MQDLISSYNMIVSPGERKQTRKFQKCISRNVTIPIPYWGIGIGIGISKILRKRYLEKLLIFHKV